MMYSNPIKFPIQATAQDIFTFTGTLYGEIRGGCLEDRQDVAQVILNRYFMGWSGTLQGVCRQYEQFSCWNDTDVNLCKIETAPKHDPIIWGELHQVVMAAINGKNPNRILSADSYYARSMEKAPYWAVPPAYHTFSDTSHHFWRVRNVGVKFNI